jgi:homocysteine S-methyltransferase
MEPPSKETAMPRHRDGLPQLAGQLMISDSGLETDLIFNKGWELPEFASFPLLESAAGRAALESYYREHVAVAAEHRAGFVFETATWRSNGDWGPRLGYSQARLDEVDRAAVDLVVKIRETSPQVGAAMVVSGLLGPRQDGYSEGGAMSGQQARAYHSHQVDVLAGTECDLVSALTLSYVNEAVGIALAARDANLPVALSFTVETDGRLPDGTALGAAITAVDRATGGYVAYFGINCAHPDHIRPAIERDAEWVRRVAWLRANASRLSHAEFAAAEELDAGSPEELGQNYVGMRELLPELAVFGGCCGTDVRHVRQIATAVL